jgi:hypothetical protein
VSEKEQQVMSEIKQMEQKQEQETFIPSEKKKVLFPD